MTERFIGSWGVDMPFPRSLPHEQGVCVCKREKYRYQNVCVCVCVRVCTSWKGDSAGEWVQMQAQVVVSAGGDTRRSKSDQPAVTSVAEELAAATKGPARRQKEMSLRNDIEPARASSGNSLGTSSPTVSAMPAPPALVCLASDSSLILLAPSDQGRMPSRREREGGRGGGREGERERVCV